MSTSTTTNISLLGAAAPGTVTCNNKTRLNFAGVQAGTDIARLNWDGWNIHVGSTVGYLGARAKDVSSVGPLNTLGGTFQDTLQVPFAGVYVAATKGGFFIDGQLRPATVEVERGRISAILPHRPGAGIDVLPERATLKGFGSETFEVCRLRLHLGFSKPPFG